MFCEILQNFKVSYLIWKEAVTALRNGILNTNLNILCFLRVIVCYFWRHAIFFAMCNPVLNNLYNSKILACFSYLSLYFPLP